MKSLKIALLAGLALAGGAAAFGMSRIPLLQDPPATDVQRLADADDLLPDRSGPAEDASERNSARVPRLGSADDDLLDLYPARPAEAAAAEGPDTATTRDRRLAAAAPGVNARFDFDLVVGYVVQAPEAGLIQSYFLLDRDGNIGFDAGALKSMPGGTLDGDGNTIDFQVMTNAGDHYAYMTSAEMGPIAMSLKSGQTAPDRARDAAIGAQQFARSMKPTGQVRDIGRNLSNRPYRSVEYAGIDPDSAQPVRMWLAEPDFQTAFGAAIYMGVGVVTLHGAEGRRLVTRVEGGGATMDLSYISRRTQHFSGAGYRDLSPVVDAYTQGAGQ